jgi:HEAT repeat protein
MPTPMSQEPTSNLFGRALDALAQGSFDPRELAGLSDLNLPNQRAFEAAWLRYPEATRVEAVRAINDLAASSLEFWPDRALDSAIRLDPSATVRQLAIWGSFERSDADFVHLLLRLTATDPSIDVRAAAASALANFCDIAVYGSDEGIEELEPEIRSRLVSVIEDPREHPLVRGGALESVAAFGTDEFVTTSIRDAFDSGDDGLRASSLIAMGRTCDRRWLGELLDALRSDDIDIRRAAAVACGALGEPDALVSLGTVARDQDAGVRAAAIYSLGQIGGSGASTILKRLRAKANNEESKLIDAALEDSNLTEILDQADGFEDDSW